MVKFPSSLIIDLSTLCSESKKTRMKDSESATISFRHKLPLSKWISVCYFGRSFLAHSLMNRSLCNRDLLEACLKTREVLRDILECFSEQARGPILDLATNLIAAWNDLGNGLSSEECLLLSLEKV